MPSWIREKDGLEWYDEAYTTRQTNQSSEQLAKKATAKEIRRFKLRNGGYWYARPDVEQLREAYLKRKARAKKRTPSEKQLEARYRRQSEVIAKTSRQGRGGPVTAHFEQAMIKEIFVNEAKRKREKK